MIYRHSELWPTPKAGSDLTLQHLTVEMVDEHMKLWSEAGWSLVSATTLNADFGNKFMMIHSFFWSKDTEG